jgi:hypothetical protein
MARRHAFVALGVVALAPAGASADPCRVNIVAAPANVRAEIETWVRAEPKCARQLEVRVAPAEGGYDLHARDDRGHVRTRVVPDAQSVAVLVVSWMADDSVAAAPLPVEVPSFADAPATDFEIPPPIGAIGEPPPAPTLVAPAPGAARAQRWVSFGVLAGPNGGIRGQIDLVAHRRFRFGIAGGFRHVEDDDHDRSMPVGVIANDRGGERGTGIGSARIYAGTYRTLGPVELRAHIGVGVDAIHTWDTMTGDDDGKVVPKAEAGVFAGMRVGKEWGVLGGPVIDKTIGDDKRGNVSLFVGLRRGL